MTRIELIFAMVDVLPYRFQLATTGKRVNIGEPTYVWMKGTGDPASCD
jgi:hypothetical protein